MCLLHSWLHRVVDKRAGLYQLHQQPLLGFLATRALYLQCGWVGGSTHWPPQHTCQMLNTATDTPVYLSPALVPNCLDTGALVGRGPGSGEGMSQGSKGGSGGGGGSGSMKVEVETVRADTISGAIHQGRIPSTRGAGRAPGKL
jgi:hypothetical protein